MAKTTKRRFTDEFKREAVALWETSGRTQAEIARVLGITPTMLRRWQRGLGVNSGKPAAQPPTSTMVSPADQASEIARLRRELDRTRMERDILKKAMVGSTGRRKGIDFIMSRRFRNGAYRATWSFGEAETRTLVTLEGRTIA